MLVCDYVILVPFLAFLTEAGGCTQSLVPLYFSEPCQAPLMHLSHVYVRLNSAATDQQVLLLPIRAQRDILIPEEVACLSYPCSN
jgi:hypothetical protein